MSAPVPTWTLSRDPGLLAHWQKAFVETTLTALDSWDALERAANGKRGLVWLDLAMPQRPAWDSPRWSALHQRGALRLIAASSNPKDEEAIAALDAGCAGYCHAYADPAQLRQVAQVVQAGHVWIGPALMQKLIRSASQARPARQASDWAQALTARETQVAQLVAQGASNLDIASQCGISERTVKAHLSAVFEKLAVVDRMQLALKVHGIQ